MNPAFTPRLAVLLLAMLIGACDRNAAPAYQGYVEGEYLYLAAPQAGTWYVTVRGYSAYSGATLRGSYSGGN